MSQKPATVCSYSKCGRSFAEPIQLNVRTEEAQKHYRACPHCFSPVDLRTARLENRKKEWTESPSNNLKNRLSETLPGLDLNEIVSVIEKVEPCGCAYFVGYLKTRQKDSPIPDQCLSCAQLIKCM